MINCFHKDNDPCPHHCIRVRRRVRYGWPRLCDQCRHLLTLEEAHHYREADTLAEEIKTTATQEREAWEQEQREARAIVVEARYQKELAQEREARRRRTLIRQEAQRGSK